MWLRHNRGAAANDPAAGEKPGGPRMNNDSFVFVVDDDAQSREAVCALVRSMQLRAEPLPSAEAFLDHYRGQSGCVVADLRMHGLSGIEMQEELRRRVNLAIFPAHVEGILFKEILVQ